jgi:xanthine dehydrogenase accessory factor
MFEIAVRLRDALDAGCPLVIATAVSIVGSAPRTVGTSMAFDGVSVIGSIAGGCVEGAVVGVCEEVLVDGIAQTVEYGVSDDDAFAVGLTCGGRIRIHVQPVTDALAAAIRAAASGAPAGFATVISRIATPSPVISSPGISTTVISSPAISSTVISTPGISTSTNNTSGTGSSHLSSSGSGARIAAELTSRIALAKTALATIDCDGEQLEIFFETSAPKPRMIIFGAMEFSAALSNAAQVLGYRVTLCDPRPLFATEKRFPGAEIVVGWPTTYLDSTEVDARTAICVLSHDARFDAEIIAQALALEVAFVGAMGSRITHDRRVASLRERSVSPADIARLRSPIGLDIGSSTPEETAISILAEIIQARTSSSGAPLATTIGAIHRASDTATGTATANVSDCGTASSASHTLPVSA